MKPLQLFLLAVFGLWLAAGCQQTIAPRLSLGGASPDFLLVIVAVLAIGGTRRAGAVLGFFAGFLMGSLAGANLASYVVTRTLAGFLCGWLTSLELEANPFVAGLITLLMTLFAQICSCSSPLLAPSFRSFWLQSGQQWSMPSSQCRRLRSCEDCRALLADNSFHMK